ncbi:MAG: HlyD family secretion protein [Desulfobacteraceae bacterium]|nr:HlyD family secretion protein [Desulfobacteraceae bacterium]
MNQSLFSTYWYRVAKLKPMLRASAKISRHVYKGRPWYVMMNSLNGRNHRFNAAAYALIGQMDGTRTVQEIWENAGQQLADAAPTQDELILLLGLLHQADLIQSDILPSTAELFRQAPGGRDDSWKQRISNPFSMRFPLFDPDRFLEKWSFLTAPLFTRGAFLAWLLIVVTAMVGTCLNWPELSGNLSDRLFLPQNLLLLWLVFPLVKILHEFGHAFAVKKWGGEVHELGIMLLAMTPIPYVNATASASFSEKRHRIAVSAMGMAVELLLASLALLVWLNVETGLISAIAYNVMLIAGASTVLFNGNPLLRYDGYYILADLIEIPNLNRRSTRYIGYLFQRYLLGIETAESPVTAPGEKAWFLVYAPVSFCYRLAVLTGLMLLISSRFFGVGVLVALWGGVSLLILPPVRTLSRFLNSPEGRSRGSRLAGMAIGLALGIVLLFFILPVPLRTATQGVVWLPEQSAVRAGADCEVVEVLAPGEEFVAGNVPLIRGADPFLEADIKIYKARLEELYAGYNAQPRHKRVKRKMLLEEIQRVKKDLEQAEAKRDKLVVRSPAQGRFILIEARNLPGHFVKKGELLGYIIAEHHPTVRAVVPQADIGLVRKKVTGVEVRLAEQPATPLRAEIKRIIPAAALNLPSAALGTGGGGDIPMDPTDPDGLRALETHFQLDLSLPEEIRTPHIGGRVFVRIEHGTMPLAMQWYRRLRQLFLRKFYV